MQSFEPFPNPLCFEFFQILIQISISADYLFAEQAFSTDNDELEQSYAQSETQRWYLNTDGKSNIPGKRDMLLKSSIARIWYGHGLVQVWR
jgi:hypothetical protein